LEEICARLRVSGEICQLRQATDIQEFALRANGPWAGRVELLGVAPGPDGSLCLPVEIKDLSGLLFDGERLRLNTRWTGAVFLPPSYPHIIPGFRFTGARIPFASHVIHPDRNCAIQETELPRQLLGFLDAIRNREAGWTCFLDGSQWSPSRRYNISLLLYLVSRIVCGARFRGELASLNPLAVQHFSRLGERAKLPLGPPLSYPEDDTLARSEADAEEDDDIEWK
jgi:hypothetical protein